MRVESERDLSEALRDVAGPVRIVGGDTRPVGARGGARLSVAIRGIFAL